MTPTPYPRNLMHVGSARALTLAAPLVVPPSGDIDITVEGDITAQGWITIPEGLAIVVTVGRGEAYESKYLVSSSVAGAVTSTLTVLAADRNYDGTLPVNAPAGALVEHTISATEMYSVTDHMRTKSAHGADGDLVDTNSAQTLSNKTFDGAVSVPTPTLNAHAANKAYADTKLPLAGGVVTGNIVVNNPGSGDINRGFGYSDGGVLRWWVAYEATNDKLNFYRYDASGNYVDAPIEMYPNGLVVLTSIRAGVFTANTDLNALLTIPLPPSPTGNWSVTVTPVLGNAAFTPIVSQSATSVTVKAYAPNLTNPMGTPVTVNWHAIAY